MSPLLKTRVGGAWVERPAEDGFARVGGIWVPYGGGGGGGGEPQNIFGTETPTNVAEDGVALAQGVRFSSSVSGTATQGRWWCGVSPPTSAKAAIYRVSDQAQLGAATFGTLSALAWNTVNFASPIALSAGVTYAAVCWTANRYPYTPSYSWPKVSGNLTATGAYFSIAADLTFPTSGSTLNFFCDLTFVPD